MRKWKVKSCPRSQILPRFWKVPIGRVVEIVLKKGAGFDFWGRIWLPYFSAKNVCKCGWRSATSPGYIADAIRRRYSRSLYYYKYVWCSTPNTLRYSTYVYVYWHHNGNLKHVTFSYPKVWPYMVSVLQKVWKKLCYIA